MTDGRRGRAGRLRAGEKLRIWCALWVRVATSLESIGGNASESVVTEMSAAEMIAASGIALIPSAPRTLLIPSAPITSSGFPTGLIPSAPLSSNISPSTFSTSDETSLIPPSNTITEHLTSKPSRHTGLIPSAPILLPTTLDNSTPPQITPSLPINGTALSSTTNVVPTLSILPPGMTSTLEGLHPIPAPSADPGDPDGHHEIPEPNFSITLPCRGCSPAIEVTATGWETVPTIPVNIPPAQEQETKGTSSSSIKPAVTVSAGSSNIIIRPDPSGGGEFVIGDGTTARPGQTVTVNDNTPVAIQTSDGRTDIIIGGTRTVPLKPPYYPPVATVTAGSSSFVIEPVPSGGKFIVGDQTTVTAGQTFTVSNTPVVVQTDGSSTRVVVGGTQTIPLTPPDMTNTPILLPITFAPGITATPLPPTGPRADPGNPQPAGYVVLSQTLLPGGPPVIISGTMYSLAPSATALVVNGQTQTLQPSYGTLHTTVIAAPLTLWGHVYTANRAGYYSLSPGTTLVPGGPAVTVSGSVISLEAHGTAALIQGSTSAMQPTTTVVTLARSTSLPADTGAGAPLPTVREHSLGAIGRVGGVMLLGVVLGGLLGVR